MQTQLECSICNYPQKQIFIVVIIILLYTNICTFIYLYFIGAKQLKISFLLQNASEDILKFLRDIYGEEKVKSIQKKDAYNLLKTSSAKVNLFSYS